MNVKELIGKYEYLNHNYFRRVDTSEVLRDLKQLDEPEKVKVPQFVADWIEVCKEHLTTSPYTAMNPNFMKENNQSFDLILWIKKTSNQETFARAWLDGYKVEKEKRYLVKMKGLNEDNSYLNYDSIDDEWYFTDAENGPAVGTHHTRKQLEEAGFSEVFNSPLFEVEEVEE